MSENKMAKLMQEPMKVQDIQEYLDQEADFQLEIQVLKVCKSLDLRVIHGGFYKDPFTNKTRQFDIQAKDKTGNLRIAFSIECKNLASNYPLVITTLPRTQDLSSHNILTIQKHPTSGFEPSFRVKKIENSQIYKEADPVGKGMSQIGKLAHDGSFTSGDAEVYDKWSQAINQYYGLFEDYKKESLTQMEIESIFIFPILVVPKDTLWIAKYDSSGNLIEAPSQATSVDYFVGIPNETATIPPPTHLHIITVDELKSFIERAVLNPYYGNAILGK